MSGSYFLCDEARSFVSLLVWELGMKCEEHLEALEQLPGGMRRGQEGDSCTSWLLNCDRNCEFLTRPLNIVM